MKLSAKTSVLAVCIVLLGCNALSGIKPDESGGSNGDGDGSNPDNPGELPDVPLSQRCETSALATAGLRRLTAQEFQRSVEDIFPQIAEKWGGVALGADPVGPSGFTTDARTLVVGPQSAEEIYRTALDVATLITSVEHLTKVLPCAGATPDSACAQTFIDGFAPRIYRRPITETERAELVAYFESVLGRSDFPMALKWTIVTMLQSPYFIYRSELGDQAGNLTPHEIATQMSYTFSGTTPSPELVSRAEAGEFSSSESRVATARSLLATENGQAVLDDFLKQWSGYEEVRGVAKNDVPNFAEVREAMVEETRVFLRDVIVTSGGDVASLLTAPYTYTNDLLAAHYGYGAASPTFTRTERPAGYGIGLLAQGSILAAKAHPDITSPVFRGLFVFENLLCGERPPVPDAVPPISEAPPANTTREKFELSHGTGACRTCHETFEPYGFALESYDPSGRFRETENGFDIDTADSVVTPTGAEMSFDGLEDLAQQLAGSPLVSDCVSGQVAAYAFSGAGGEVCVAEEQRTALASGVYGLLEFYAQLAAAPSMTVRNRP